MAALYLQVSIISQALIFVTRSRSWSYVERPGLLLLGAFMIAQLVILLLSAAGTYGCLLVSLLIVRLKHCHYVLSIAWCS